MSFFKLLERFTNENKITQAPYILCNETGQENTLALLVKNNSSADHSGVHIGFSVWFNLDLLAVCPAKFALILDINTSVYLIYKKIEQAFIQSSTPELFIQALMDSLSETPQLLMYPPEHQHQLFLNELNKKRGFLSSQSYYERIQKMVKEGRIFFGCADLSSVEDITLILRWVQQTGEAINTLYISNIAEWIFEYGSKQQQETLLKNLQNLKGKETTIIDAFYPTLKKSGFGPPLRVTQEVPSFIKENDNKRKTNLYLTTHDDRCTKRKSTSFLNTNLSFGYASKGIKRPPERSEESPESDSMAFFENL